MQQPGGAACAHCLHFRVSAVALHRHMAAGTWTLRTRSGARPPRGACTTPPSRRSSSGSRRPARLLLGPVVAAAGAMGRGGGCTSRSTARWSRDRLTTSISRVGKTPREQGGRQKALEACHIAGRSCIHLLVATSSYTMHAGVPLAAFRGVSNTVRPNGPFTACMDLWHVVYCIRKHGVFKVL